MAATASVAGDRLLFSTAMGERAGNERHTRTWPTGWPADETPGVALPQRWELGRRLGQGGQAEVWLARDRELGEWVAIKVFKADLSATARERLRREVRLGRTLLHPHLVRLFELLEHEDRLAVVMEWMPGGSLAQRLAAGPLAVEEVARVADEVLAALEYLHGENVVHRDVKPSNLLLDANGSVRLADLGLASSPDAGPDLTATDMAVGTPAYMSPEQIRGEKLTPASDLYALGITLYQLLTGTPPFSSSSALELASLHVSGRVRDPRHLRESCPAWLANFVLRLLEKRPEDRFRNAAEARRALGRRRASPSPRAYRKAAFVLLVGGAAAFVMGGAASLVRTGIRDRATQRIVVSGATVSAVDKAGKTFWQQTLSHPILQAEQVDVDGDGQQEVAVVSAPSAFDLEHRNEPSEIVVLGRDGTSISRIHPEDLIASWRFAFAKAFVPRLKRIDLGGDNRSDLVAICDHRAFFPSAVLVYWPSVGLWEPVLLHSGNLGDIVVVPGSRPPRVRFVGINNRAAMTRVVGEVEIPPPTEHSRLPARMLNVAPDPFVADKEGVRLLWYTPLAESVSDSVIAVGANGETSTTLNGARYIVDRWGNPVPGPNAGRDHAAERVRFFESLSELRPSAVRTTPDGVRRAAASIEAAAGTLLAETPMRAILDLYLAQGLAQAGDLDGGVALLRAAFGANSYDDLGYRLANLEALAGRLEEAESVLDRLVEHHKTPRATYDAVQLRLRLYIDRRAQDRLHAAAAPFAGQLALGESMQFTAALLARAHLWWDQVSEPDCAVRSWAYVPEGDALACLARWRLGRTAPGDPAAMEAAAVRDPDAGFECRTAQGAALLGLDRAREALTVLSQLIDVLEPQSRDDFSNRQVLDLARALRVKALRAAGHRAEALAEARRIRSSLTPGLLPRILVDEVLGEREGRIAARR